MTVKLYSCPRCFQSISPGLTDGKHCPHCGTELAGLDDAKSEENSTLIGGLIIWGGILLVGLIGVLLGFWRW
jgi:hypothetical protein